jgi:hypothetical protein
MPLRRQVNAARLAKDRHAVRIGAKRVKQRDWIAQGLALAIRHVEQGKAERKRQQGYEVERIGRADRAVELKAQRGPERVEVKLALVGRQHGSAKPLADVVGDGFDPEPAIVDLTGTRRFVPAFERAGTAEALARALDLGFPRRDKELRRRVVGDSGQLRASKRMIDPAIHKLARRRRRGVHRLRNNRPEALTVPGRVAGPAVLDHFRGRVCRGIRPARKVMGSDKVSSAGATFLRPSFWSVCEAGEFARSRVRLANAASNL